MLYCHVLFLSCSFWRLVDTTVGSTTICLRPSLVTPTHHHQNNTNSYKHYELARLMYHHLRNLALLLIPSQYILRGCLHLLDLGLYPFRCISNIAISAITAMSESNAQFTFTHTISRCTVSLDLIIRNAFHRRAVEGIAERNNALFSCQHCKQR
jgi:hypothetical protein